MDTSHPHKLPVRVVQRAEFRTGLRAVIEGRVINAPFSQFLRTGGRK